MLPSIARSRSTSRISSVFVTFFQTRDLSSAEAKPIRVNKNISFRPAIDSPIEQAKRPISVIYGWLVAKSRHIYKYGDFYLGKGFDVMHIKVQPQQLLWPTVAQGVISEALDYLGQEQRAQQPVLIHAFSVGGYLYGETQVKMVNDPKYSAIGKRIVGQIFDSPVGFIGIPEGVGKAVTPIPVLQKTIQLTLENYLKVFKNYTTKHYLLAEDTCHKNPLKVPSLCLYSTADPIGLAGPIEHLMRTMEEHGSKVYGKCWNDSKHVSHFHQHPVEYIQQLNGFLENIGLTKYSEQLARRSATS